MQKVGLSREKSKKSEKVGNQKRKVGNLRKQQFQKSIKKNGRKSRKFKNVGNQKK